MENKIKHPYLIQRANFADRDFEKGIDSIMKFDYMGSAEFEFGTLPDTLQEIRDNIESFTYLEAKVKDKEITVFCHEDHEPQVIQHLIDISDSKFRTKEWHAFDDYVNDDGYFKDRVDIWWDLDNNIMFWKKSPEFEEKFKSIIENKPE